MFDKHYNEGKTHLTNARKQKSDGRLKDALDAYQKAIDKFKAQLSSRFHNKAINTKRCLADAYEECGDIFKGLGKMNNADSCYKEAQKYGSKYCEVLTEPDTSKNSSISLKMSSTSLTETAMPDSLQKFEFFTQDPLLIHTKLENVNDILSTRDLSYYLKLNSHDREQAPQLVKLALETIELFAQRKIKTKEMIHEVIALSSIPNKKIYEELLEHSIQAIDNRLQHSEYLFCLTQVIQNMPDLLLVTGEVGTGNLVTILTILHTRLKVLHKQDEDQLCELLQTICPLLDAMVRIGVKGINREQLHTPLYRQLKELEDNPMLAYHARYACQALLHIPNDECLWKEVMRRTFKVAVGTINLVSAVKNLDPDKLLDTFKDFNEAFESVCNIVSCIQELIETDQTLKEKIEDIQLEFEQTRQWYLALRFIDILLQENQLVKFEQFVRQSPYKKNKWFLIGLCQRLGQIACTQRDLKIQQGAVLFLGDLYYNKTQWGQDSEVREWVFSVLRQLANQDYENLKNYAKAMLNKVTPNEATHIRDVYCFHMWNSVDFNSRLLVEARLKLSQNLASNADKLLMPLDKIKKEYLNELEQDEEIKDALSLYVPSKGKWFLNSMDSFDLEAKVDAFLASEKKVLLLLGEAGAGKSTFNRHLARRLWADSSSKDELDNKLIPIFISLPSIENPNEKIIHKYLRGIGFSEEIIENLKQNSKFVFILDGYDEIRDRQSKFYDKNEFHKWNSKIIIGCRSEYLSTKYQQKFIPNHTPKFFQEMWLAPFSKEEVREYIRKYVEKQKDIAKKILWDVQSYEAVLKRIPHSDQLLSNPFILKIAMQIIPDFGQQENKSLVKTITRLTLYNKFVDKWFERSQDRLSRIQLDEKEKEAFKELDENDFTRHCIQFNKDLTIEMFKVNEVVVEYSGSDDTSWRAKFFGYKDPKTRLLRYNSPLSRNGDQYRFIHKSLFEYFVARAICEAIFKEARSALFEENLILRESEIIRFLTEYVKQSGGPRDIQQAEKFKENLLVFIEKSKKDTGFEIAAANAITILNKTGMVFSGKNLNGIHIAGADLSYGLFDRSQFKGADLSNVDFRKAWLRYADFSNANMSGVQFGELPFLDLKDSCKCCCYSQNGHFLAIASGKKICLYNAETLEKIHTFEGHTGEVNSVTFSPDGTQLASGGGSNFGSDNTVRLWSLVNLDQNPCILEGHVYGVSSVTFSPDGTQLASGSYDTTVRLWSLENLDQNPRILGHVQGVSSVTFSPDCTQLASGSLDRMVRLWSLNNLDQDPLILEGHTWDVNNVTFSPDGTHLASGSLDNTVRLWSLENLDQNPRILRHNGTVWGVAFSPDGTKLASGSLDNTVQLWSLENLDQNPCILEGHTKGVNSVTFSPDGIQLASGSSDYTVRLWSLENLNQNLCILEGHTNGVNSVAFSPDGTQLASGSSDYTVRLWSHENLDQNPCILKGHTYFVNSVTFSPDGTQLASGSGSTDNTVRLWSLENLNQNPRILEGHVYDVNSVTFSPDGTLLASGSDDSTVRLWSLENLDQNPCILKGHGFRVMSVAFSPDGTQLASGSIDKTVRLWSLKNLDRNPRILKGHTYGVKSVSFSPDGTQLASAGLDNTVRLWSLENLDLNPHILEGHTGCVNGVAFSPDGTQLASSSSDKTVRLWSMASGHCLAIIYFPSEIYSLAWNNTKAKDFLLTGGRDRNIRLWHVKRIDDRRSQVTLHWTSYQNILWVFKAFIQNVKGLSSMDMRLLKQRDATEDSVAYLNENN